MTSGASCMPKQVKHKIFSHFCCSPSEQGNNTNMEKGSFYKSLKIEKTIAQQCFTELSYYKERSERPFKLFLVFQGGFDVCYQS